MTADAFIHLPDLRARVTHPEKSLLRLTPEMFSMWEQRARAAGLPADWRLPDEAIEASRLAVLSEHRSGDDLWIYCYGSLMWDPGFHFVEVRLADLEGYQRRFTLKIDLGRGSRDFPALDAFAGAAARTLPRTGVPYRGFLRPCRNRDPLAARDAARRLCAGDGADGHAAGADLGARLCLEPCASKLCRRTAAWRDREPDCEREGDLGTNREYLVQLATQLEALRIDDPYVQKLHAQISSGPIPAP